MSQSTAIVPTENASRYLQQLCKHWGHRFKVAFTPEAGEIEFADGKVLSLTSAENRLVLDLRVPANEDAGVMQGVVAEHLQRFAHKEELVVAWAPAADIRKEASC